MKKNEKAVYDYLKKKSNGKEMIFKQEEIARNVIFRKDIFKVEKKLVRTEKWSPSAKAVKDVLIRLERQNLLKAKSYTRRGTLISFD